MGVGQQIRLAADRLPPLQNCAYCYAVLGRSGAIMHGQTRCPTSCYLQPPHVVGIDAAVLRGRADWQAACLREPTQQVVMEDCGCESCAPPMTKVA
jgi:hypothetical protein